MGGKYSATVGGVLFAPDCMQPLRDPEVRRGAGGSIIGARVGADGRRMLYFAARLSDSCVERLMATSENPIAAIELLAVVLGMRVWRSIVAQCACIVFVDNDAARHALIRAYSPNLELCGLCELAAREEAHGADALLL